MIIKLSEILSIIIVSLYLGYLFSGFIAKKTNWSSIRFSILITAPAIILHELFHKFTAILLGYNATFYGFYSNPFSLMLAIASIILRIVKSPFIFIIPGYVVPVGVMPGSTAIRIIAFAGPFANLLIWFITTLMLKKQVRSINKSRNTKNKDMGYDIKNVKFTPSFLRKNKKILALIITKRINMFLFIFNMIPFAPFDGSKVFFG